MKIQMRSRSVSALMLVVCSLVATSAAQSKAPAMPANTVVSIRMMEPVDSEAKSPLREYRATVDDSVIVNGVTVVPVGASAFVRLMEVQQAGAVKGRAVLSLRLVALEVDGQRVELRTGNATVKSASQAGKTTKAGVAGGIVGGLFGALVGGKAGAAKGAALGAAAGVGVAAASGQRIKIPAETRMSFKLRPAVDSVLLGLLLDFEEESSAKAQVGDKKAIERMLAPDFTMTMSGRRLTRKEFLSTVKPIPSLLDWEVQDAAAKEDGDRATLTEFRRRLVLPTTRWAMDLGI